MVHYEWFRITLLKCIVALCMLRTIVFIRCVAVWPVISTGGMISQKKRAI